MNDTKFIVNDYDDVTVVSTKSRWDSHVSIEHPIMDNNIKAVKDTIKKPDTVYASSQNEDRKVFFKQSEFSTYNLKTKVIVEYAPSKNNPDHIVGNLVTAFPVKDEKGGISDVIYSKCNNKL